MKSGWSIIGAVSLALLALAAQGCGQGRDVIRIDGSSTVFPISEAAAEEFSKETRARINVGFSGTGAGFEKFCRGDTDISAASRPIKDEEVAACAASGIEDVVEIQVAIDALTVMVNPSNEFADCMNVEELNLAFRGDGASTWSDIRPEWPDDTITFYYPGTDSGTFDYFEEEVIEGVDETAIHRGDGTASEDDNVLAIGIENDRNAIGYFGFAYFQEAGAALKAIGVDGGQGCVEPSIEAAAAGTYPLSRPLFIYMREKSLREKPTLLEFVTFYLDNSEALVLEVGYVPLPGELLEEQTAKIEAFRR